MLYFLHYIKAAPGGSYSESARALAIDEQGSMWVCGSTYNSLYYEYDAFLASFSPDGNLTKAVNFGSGKNDYCETVTIDAQGDVWLAGFTDSFSSMGRSAMVAKFSSSANLLYAGLLFNGGQSYDGSRALAKSMDGRISFGANQYVFQKIENVIVGGVNAVASALPITAVQLASFTLNVPANDSFAIIKNTTVSLPLNLTTDITAEITPVSIVDYLTDRPYGLSAVAPLYQKAVLHQPFTVDVLADNTTTLNATYGLDISVLPDWLRYDFINNRLTGTPTASVRGEYWIDLLVEDFYDKQWRYQMLVEVPNTAPSYQGNTTLIMAIDGFVSVPTVAEGFSDADGDSYQFALSSQPAPPPWLIVAKKTGVVSATMVSGYQGNYTVNITATDDCNNPNGCGDMGWQLFELVVPNRAPTFQSDLVVPKTIQLGVDSSFQYVLSSDAVTDPDGDTISWVAKSANGSVLPVGLTFSSAARRLRGIPTAGVYSVALIALDGHGGVVNQTISLRVNSQPVANMTDTLIALPGVHKSFAWRLPTTAMLDVDGDALSYELVNNDPRYLVPSWLSFNGTTLTGTPGSNSHQPIPLLIRGKDPFGGVGDIPMSLHIKNLPPVAQLTLRHPAVLQVGKTLSYSFSSDVFIDPEGDSLQYRALTVTGNGTLPLFLSFNPITRALSGKPKTIDAGRYAITFQADDGYGGIANSSSVLVHVNTEPRVDLASWEVIAKGVGKPFAATIPSTAMFDADGGPISYELVADDLRYLIPAWLSFNGSTLIGTPGSNSHRPIQLLIKGKDPFGGIGQLPVSLTIQNTPPKLLMDLPTPDTLQLGDGSKVDYLIQADVVVDVDGDAIVWSASLSGGTALPAGLVFNPASKQLSGLTVAGIYEITFTASDGYGGFANQTVTLRVNNQPIVAMTDSTVPLPGIHKPFAWTLPAGLMVDADGDAITYELVRANPEYIVPSWVNFNGTALFGTPTANTHQLIKLLFTGKDVFGGVGTAIISLLIENLSPRVQIVLADAAITQVGEELSYSFSGDTFADPEGDSLRYKALMLVGDASLPDFLNFNPITRTLSGLPSAVDAGNYSLVFQVDDGYGGVANSSAVHFQINTPPTALSSAWPVDTLPVGQNFIATLPDEFITDADGDVISYSLVRTNQDYLVPVWLNLVGRTLSGRPLRNSHQAIIVQLKAEDGFGGEAYRLVSIKVPNSAPLVDRAIGTITTYADELKTFVVPRDTVTDADGDELSFTVFKTANATATDRLPLPKWVTHLVGINSFNLLPKSGDQGNYTFVLVATDPQGASVQTRFAIAVPNRAPVLATAYADKSLGALEDLSYAVTGHFVDPDGDELSYAISKPAWVQYDSTSMTLSGLPPQWAKVYEVFITVDDCYGGRAQAGLRVKVNPTDVQLNAVQMLQLFGYGGVGLSLLVASSLFMLVRHKRTKLAEQGAKDIMHRWLLTQGGSRSQVVQAAARVNYQAEVIRLLSALQHQLEMMDMQVDRAMLQQSFQRVESAIRRYYNYARGRQVATITGMLLNSGFMKTLLRVVRMAVVDKWPLEIQRTLSGILHYSVRLLWMCHTGKARRLDEVQRE